MIPSQRRRQSGVGSHSANKPAFLHFRWLSDPKDLHLAAAAWSPRCIRIRTTCPESAKGSWLLGEKIRVGCGLR